MGKNSASVSGLLQHQVPVHQRELRLETMRLHRELVSEMLVTGGSKIIRSEIRIFKDLRLSFFYYFFLIKVAFTVMLIFIQTADRVNNSILYSRGFFFRSKNNKCKMKCRIFIKRTYK